MKPSYSLRHLDPSAPASKNRYAVALSDSYVPDILYGEALVIPKWTQPNLSQDAIRANGGVPPPPEPILPSEFTIQLYNPDQQVIVRHKPGAWNSAVSWVFEMPQQTFRQPSSSALDRTMSDPAASDTTPKLRFSWRKDGRLSKDLGCYLSGKTASRDGASKKSKEPDITVAIFKGLKEMTLYEPNLYRVEMEDFKGLEVVLMLSAIIIRDVYFGNMKECFHVSDPPKTGSPVQPSASPVNGHPPRTNGIIQPPPNQGPQRPNPRAQQQQQLALQQQQQQPQQKQQQQQQQGAKPPPNQQPRPPPADPRTQWEIDQETGRLKQQSESESRERRRREKESEKQAKRMLEAEQKEARRRQAQLDKETERLARMYGKEDKEYRKHQGGGRQQQQQPPQQPPRPSSTRPPPPQQHHRPPRPSPNPPPRQPTPHVRFASHSGPIPTTHGPSSPRPSATQSSAQLRPPGPAPPATPQQQPPPLRDRRSILGLFKRDEEQGNTLTKKKSSMF